MVDYGEFFEKGTNVLLRFGSASRTTSAQSTLAVRPDHEATPLTFLPAYRLDPVESCPLRHGAEGAAKFPQGRTASGDSVPLPSI